MPEALKRYVAYLGGLAALALLAAAYWVNVIAPWDKGVAARAANKAVAALANAQKPVPQALADAAAAANASLNATYAQSWIMTVVLMIAFMALVGIGLNNRPAGVLIGTSNKVSLSKFQMALWTVVVLSALITGVCARIVGAPALPPLAMSIPNELLAAMGIAATSLVAAPSLVSLKAAQPGATPEAIAAAAERTGRAAAEVVTAGQVVGFNSPMDARWMDMFRGDEANTFGSADLSKVQQFLITIVVVGVYAAAVWQAFIEGKPLSADKLAFLPTIDSDFVWLLLISHGGYLAAKVTPTPSGAPPAASTPPTIDSDGAAG
jgi:hypothetical protein